MTLASLSWVVVCALGIATIPSQVYAADSCPVSPPEICTPDKLTDVAPDMFQAKFITGIPGCRIVVKSAILSLIDAAT